MLVVFWGGLIPRDTEDHVWVFYRQLDPAKWAGYDTHDSGEIMNTKSLCFYELGM